MNPNHQYQCPICRQVRHQFPAGDGVWFPSCCWANARVVWNAKRQAWKLHASTDHMQTPCSLAAQLHVKGYEEPWRPEVQNAYLLKQKLEAFKRRRLEEDRLFKEQLKERINASMPEGPPKKPAPTEASAPAKMKAPIWWNYLRAELLANRKLNERREARWRKYDWASARHGSGNVDERMIKGGWQRANTTRRAVWREMKNYYDSGILTGAF